MVTLGVRTVEVFSTFSVENASGRMKYLRLLGFSILLSTMTKKNKKAPKAPKSVASSTMKMAATTAKAVAKQAVKEGLKAAGRAGGGVVGAQFGMPMQGARLGESLGAKLSRLIGTGEYAAVPIHGPAEISPLVRMKPGRTIVQNRGLTMASNTSVVSLSEYLGQLVPASTGYSVRSFEMTPTNPCFPVASSVASCYGEWQAEQVFVALIPTTTLMANSGNPGWWGVCRDTDPGAPPPASRAAFEMTAAEVGVSGRLDKALFYAMECAGREYLKTSRTGSVTSTQPGFTSCGTIHIATDTAVTGSVGEIRMMMLLRFRKQVPPVGLTANYRRAATAVAGTVFGATVASVNTSGCFSDQTPVVDATNGTITFPILAQPVEITIEWGGTTAVAWTAPSGVTVSNGTFMAMYRDPATGNYLTARAVPPTGTSTIIGMYMVSVLPTTPGIPVVLTVPAMATLPTGSSQCVITIRTMPGNTSTAGLRAPDPVVSDVAFDTEEEVEMVEAMGHVQLSEHTGEPKVVFPSQGVRRLGSRAYVA